MYGTGPEVLLGLNQRPEKVSIPSVYFLFISVYFLQERTPQIKGPLCSLQVDQQGLDLVQVKVHDIRAFATSKAFYGGVSVNQIMQACHWKAHNTFTIFYLKDLTWSDNDNNMYLGPVVVAQVLDYYQCI